jgi:hypothetical protein
MCRLIFVLIPVIVICSCNEDSLQVNVEIEYIEWAWGDSKSSFDVYPVKEGRNFGPEKSPGEYLFHCLDIISPDSILVVYDHSLYAVGGSDSGHINLDVLQFRNS